MSKPNTFWDRIAKSYSKQPVADEKTYQIKLSKTREYLRSDSLILELGCGTGSTAIAHAPIVRQVDAVDISSKMLEIAKSKAEAAKIENITFMQSNIDEFSAPDESYDVVLALSVLHLLNDRNAAIAQVMRMLKPGGVFISSTVCLGRGKQLLKIVAPIGNFFGLLPQLGFFTAEELKKNLTNAGFEIDHYWLPGKDKAVFIVAKKPD